MGRETKQGFVLALRGRERGVRERENAQRDSHKVFIKIGKPIIRCHYLNCWCHHSMFSSPCSSLRDGRNGERGEIYLILELVIREIRMVSFIPIVFQYTKMNCNSFLIPMLGLVGTFNFSEKSTSIFTPSMYSLNSITVFL